MAQTRARQFFFDVGVVDLVIEELFADIVNGSFLGANIASMADWVVIGYGSSVISF